MRPLFVLLVGSARGVMVPDYIRADDKTECLTGLPAA